MWKLALVFVSAVIIAAACGYFGPVLARAVFDVNIVADPTSGAAYVGTVVTIFSALIGGGAAYVLHEERKSEELAAELRLRERERILRVRTSAILLKTRIRPALKDLCDLFDLAIAIMGTDRFREIKRKGEFPGDWFPETMGPNEFEGLRESLLQTNATIEIDADVAASLAYLGDEELEHLLNVQGHWDISQMTSPSFSLENSLDRTEANGLFYNLEAALNSLLRLNHELNLIVLRNYLNRRESKLNCTDSWIEQEHNDFPL